MIKREPQGLSVSDSKRNLTRSLVISFHDGCYGSISCLAALIIEIAVKPTALTVGYRANIIQITSVLLA